MRKIFIPLLLLTLSAFLLILPNINKTYQPSDGGWEEARLYLAAPVLRTVYAPTPEPDDIKYYEKSIATCLPERDNAKYYNEKEIKDCLYAIFSKAAIKLETQPLAAGLSNLIVKHPLLGLPCHEITHIIGDLTLKSVGGDIRKALSLHDNPSCEAGFIHGMVDAFAVTSPSPLEFAKLVDACESSADSNMLHYCTHAVGHAAWIVTEDGVEASKYCSLLRTAEGRAQCGEGVMMDMFVPATTRFPSLEQSKAPIHLQSVCRDWIRQSSPGMIQGCAHGAAFVFSKKALAVVYFWSENKLNYPYPDKLPDEMLQDLAKVGKEVKEYCEGLGGFAGESCKSDLSIAIPHVPHPLLLRKDVRNALCSTLDKSIIENCVNQVRVNL
jgi:hypothetical protein